MTADQEALLHKARASFNAARALADLGFHDFSVSRAYYAMFYVAEAFLLGEGLSFSKHAGVIAAFGQHLVKTGRVSHEFQRYLIEAQDCRNVGDYDIRSGISMEDTELQMDRAKKFLELAESLMGSIPN